jgi:hypothetical protein
LRLFSNTFWARELLRSVAGMFSLLALPIHWFYVAHLYYQVTDLPNPPHAWLFLELAVVLVCAVFYLFARWPIPAWGSVALIALHHGLWGWLFLGGPYFWLAPFQTLVPLVSLCSSLAWSLYVQQFTESSQPRDIVTAR